MNDSHISIIFEGESLPSYAYNIDLAGNLLPGLSECAKSFLFRFTVCVDTVKTEEAGIVSGHFESLLSELSEHSEQLVQGLRGKEFPVEISSVIESWRQVCLHVFELGKGKDIVSWEGKIQ